MDEHKLTYPVVATTPGSISAVADGTNAGVIWITGYSAAGKTTVGRRVEAELRARGVPTIFLDGDDLRSIFSSRWGYEREDRVELARIYFRLCSHLSSQGYTVVISAIAMYDEVRRWLRDNVSGALEVFLNVSETERRRRDQGTKKIYDKVGDLADLYDAPDEFCLRLDNSDGADPADIAGEIVHRYLKRKPGSADFGRDEHWGGYYSRATVPVQPSPFASTVAEALKPGARFLDVGCGNGRDSAFFASRGHAVTAIDASHAAIDLCQREHNDAGIDFIHGKLPELASVIRGKFDAIYSRFVLHAMPLHEEEALLESAEYLLAEDGRLCIECRSINDPMARLGEVVSPTERIHGHYRRFIVLDGLLDRLARHGFSVIEAVESNGLAVHGDEDPVVIRVTASKSLTSKVRGSDASMLTAV